MNSPLEASRVELREAYLLALWREDYEMANFWRQELIDRTVSLMNKITEE
jgi:hypothetical protein